VSSAVHTCFNYQLNAQFLYSVIIYILHYNPRRVSSNTVLILRRSNCIVTTVRSQPVHPVAYPGIFYGGGGSTNSVEDIGQRERGSGGDSPLVRGSGGSCNLVQEMSFHIVKFS
jgi:hypothetical protein